MKRSDPGSVQRITCVGGGVIGGGWAAHFLARGYRVTVQDPGVGAQAALDRLLDTAWPTLEVNLIRFHGVFAPNRAHRARVTPAKRGKGNQTSTSDAAHRPTPAERRAAMSFERSA